MGCASDKLVLAVLDSIMLPVAHVNYSIVRAKAICMQRRREINFAANNGLNAGLFAVRDDFCIDPAITFIDAEDYCLASCSTPALATHSSSAKVRLIQLDIATERRFSLAMLGDSRANQFQITIDSIAVQSRYRSDLRGSQIKRKEPKKLTKFSTSYSCTNELLGTQCHDLI